MQPDHLKQWASDRARAFADEVLEACRDKKHGDGVDHRYEPDGLFYMVLAKLGFTDMEIAKVDEVINRICPGCWDDMRGCCCRRDVF